MSSAAAAALVASVGYFSHHITRESPEANSSGAASPQAACGDCTLVPTESGWLDRAKNRWGAQGYFYVDASGGSIVLEPARPEGHEARGWPWKSDAAGQLCLKGSTAAVVDGDYKTHWGVVAGMELCHTGPRDEPADRVLSVTDCPFQGVKAVKGVRFRLEGPKVPNEVRVVFSEIDSFENAFVPLYDAPRGLHEIKMDDARVSYQKPPRPVRRELVRGVEWLIPSRAGKPVDFEFCIGGIELL